MYSLELLNRITVAYSRLPPAIEELAIYFIERVYNGILDLWYDKQMLTKHLWDLNIFQMLFEALILVDLPIG